MTNAVPSLERLARFAGREVAPDLIANVART